MRMRITFVCLIMLLTACAKTLYPVSTGFHAPIDQSTKDKKFRFVIWGNHPAVSSSIAAMIQMRGHTIVERARIMEVFNEQKVRLTNSADDDADVLRVGRLLGADQVVFAEATVRPESYSRAYVGQYGGAARSGTTYHLSVSVRAVSVETGEVRWIGSAYYPGPGPNPEQGLVFLSQTAVLHALCPVEDGYEWIESSLFSKSRCVKKNEKS